MKTLLCFVAGALLFGAATLAFGVFGAGVRRGAREGGGVRPGVRSSGDRPRMGAPWLSNHAGHDAARRPRRFGFSGCRLRWVGHFLPPPGPDLFAIPFWAWLVLFYLTLLAFEMTLLYANSRGSTRRPQA